MRARINETVATGGMATVAETAAVGAVAKPLVSVILAVYNAAEHLEECLDSVLGQTYRNLEIICIDDGSSDESLALLERYARQDNRIAVHSQANRGAGAARNWGLQRAQGDYLSFLDSDDVFAPQMLELALISCETTGSDFCLFGSRQFNTVTGKHVDGPTTLNRKQLPMKKPHFCFRDISGNVFTSMVGWAWDKLYRTSFVRQSGLKFLEQHNSEDLFFVYSGLVLAKRISLVNRSLVRQRIRPANTSNASLSGSRAEHADDFYTSLLVFREFLQKSGLYGELEPSFINYALNYSLWNLKTLPGTAFSEVYEMLKTQGFAELGIADKPENYFQNPAEYAGYQRIIQLDPISYLQTDLAEFKAKLNRLIAKIPFGLGKLVYRLNRGSYGKPRKLP